MKRTLVIVGIATLVLVAIFATAGLAFAQGPATTPAAGTCGVGGGSWRWGANGITPLAAVAELLGLSTDDLSAQLGEGKTVLDLATEKGKSAEEVVAAVVAPRTERINAAVAAGSITQEQADLMIKTMTQRISANLEAGTLGLGNGQGAGCGAAGGGRMMGRMGAQGRQGFVDSDGDGVCDNVGTQTRGGRWGTSAQSL